MEPYTRKVYYYETDKMAIVHNANYLRIFEEARLHFMEQLQVPYTQVEAEGILIPVVDAYVRYHHTLKYGDVFRVSMQLPEYNGIKMSFRYEIRREGDEELIATGYSSHCFVDEITRIPLNMKKRMPAAHEIMMAAVSRE
ncbi:MAG: acyl-CoA thioesterase [Parasporobacterium sp.]|nr:acyl-CoA thioesterase [Parasporobacterium sp.]